MTYSFPKYDFPCKLFDFEIKSEIEFENYRTLEKYIQKQLLSNDILQVKDGLSNVLFWGYYRIGYKETRLKKFRDNITPFQLQAFKALLKNNMINPINIKKIGMPQFSGFSFISKILMFLNPLQYVVLDKKIMRLRDFKNIDNPLSNIPYKTSDSGIRISPVSQKYYLIWCELCKFIATQMSDNMIPVDIERGFFKLVENDRIEYATQIISSEMKKFHALT
jgi:hypothetical protein